MGTGDDELMRLPLAAIEAQQSQCCVQCLSGLAGLDGLLVDVPEHFVANLAELRRHLDCGRRLQMIVGGGHLAAQAQLPVERIHHGRLSVLTLLAILFLFPIAKWRQPVNKDTSRRRDPDCGRNGFGLGGNGFGLRCCCCCCRRGRRRMKSLDGRRLVEVGHIFDFGLVDARVRLSASTRRATRRDKAKRGATDLMIQESIYLFRAAATDGKLMVV